MYPSATGTQRLSYPPQGTLVERSDGEGAGVCQIYFLKYDQSFQSNMAYQLPNRINGIRIVHQHYAAHDRIKLLIQFHYRRIAFDKFHICQPIGMRALAGPSNSLSLVVCTHYFTAMSN